MGKQKPLDQLINEYRTKYDSIGRVSCKILNCDVHFNSDGKLHLLYKSNRKKRSVAEQRYKLNLFPLVIPVIKNANTIQDWRFANEVVDKDVQHYALVHKVGKGKIPVRVIIRRTGDGQFNFHSVMKHEHFTKKPRIKRGS